MAWANGEQDRAKRKAIAQLLTRQEFWRTIYVESFKVHQNQDTARQDADWALRDFEFKFRDDVS
jgi:hypothetical protein